LKATRSYTKFGPMKQFSKALLLTFAVLTLAMAAGCASTEQADYDEKPWNAPKSWESGIPQQMMQGR
jgi:hypothetical protein